jgi:hypothetical protein
MHADHIEPASQMLLALEVRGVRKLRAFFFDLSDVATRTPRRRTPVLVLPELAASDISTRPLRTFLKVLGYAAHGWKPNSAART